MSSAPTASRATRRALSLTAAGCSSAARTRWLRRIRTAGRTCTSTSRIGSATVGVSETFCEASGGVSVDLLGDLRARNRRSWMRAATAKTFLLDGRAAGAAGSRYSFDVYDAHVCSAAVPCSTSPVSPPACTSGDSCKAAPVAAAGDLRRAGERDVLRVGQSSHRPSQAGAKSKRRRQRRSQNERAGKPGSTGRRRGLRPRGACPQGQGDRRELSDDCEISQGEYASLAC